MLGMLTAAATLMSFAARADDSQELFPDNNVSSQPFVEFRARGPDKMGYAGHVFIGLGVEHDNGNRVYYAFAGFTPEPALATNATGLQGVVEGVGHLVKVLTGVNGHLDYDIEDMHDDVYFRQKVTPEQAYTTRNIIESWDTKKYNLALNSCVTLATSVARALDLKVPDGFDKITQPSTMWPVPFVRYLADHNSTDQTSRATARANTERDVQWREMHEVVEQDKHSRYEAQKREALIRGTPSSPSGPMIEVPLTQQPNWQGSVTVLPNQ